ncbi:hypothetical protein Ancab_004911 [Ancistrocladus abbreviatus]
MMARSDMTKKETNQGPNSQLYPIEGSKGSLANRVRDSGASIDAVVRSTLPQWKLKGGFARPVPITTPLTLLTEKESSPRTIRLHYNKGLLLDLTHKDSGSPRLFCPKSLD